MIKVNQYRKLREKELLKEALTIHEMFLKEDSIFHLNVSSIQKKSVEEKLFKKQTATVDIFHEIIHDIEWAMDDHLKQFLADHKKESPPSIIKTSSSFGKTTLSNLIDSFRKYSEESLKKCHSNEEMGDIDHLEEYLGDQ
jgi:hypothetical protein